MSPDTALQILGLKMPVSRAELKGAFRTAAKQNHPDATRKDSGAFREVKEAYDVLVVLVPLGAGDPDDLLDEGEDPEPEPEPAPEPLVRPTGPAGPARPTIYKQAAYYKGAYQGTGPGVYKQATPPARPTLSRVPARQP